jgi:hypothetical protein
MGVLQDLGWAGAGMPELATVDLEYSRPSGMTEASVTWPLPERKRTESRRDYAITCSAVVPAAQLGAVENALDDGGYSWFAVDLPTRWPTAVLARLSKQYGVSVLSADLFKVSLTLEVRVT